MRRLAGNSITMQCAPIVGRVRLPGKKRMPIAGVRQSAFDPFLQHRYYGVMLIVTIVDVSVSELFSLSFPTARTLSL